MKPTRAALVPCAVLALLASACGGGPTPSASAKAAASGGPAGARHGAAAKPAHPKPGAVATARARSTAASCHCATSGVGTASGAGTGAAGGASTSTVAPFTPAGSYTYDIKGSVSYAGQSHDASSTATFTVDKPASDRQHTAMGTGQGQQEDEVLVHEVSGVYLADLKVPTPNGTKEFRPATPVLGLPSPADIGRTWSWRMTSTDGKTTASFSARIVKRESVTIGGTAVAATVVQSTLTLSGDFDVSQQLTTDYDLSRSQELREHAKSSGSINGFAFTSDTTTTLRSLHAS